MALNDKLVKQITSDIKKLIQISKDNGVPITLFYAMLIDTFAKAISNAFDEVEAIGVITKISGIPVYSGTISLGQLADIAGEIVQRELEEVLAKNETLGSC